MIEKLYTKYKLSFGELSIMAKVGEKTISLYPCHTSEKKFRFHMSDRETAKRIVKLLSEAVEL